MNGADTLTNCRQIYVRAALLSILASSFVKVKIKNSSWNAPNEKEKKTLKNSTTFVAHYIVPWKHSNPVSDIRFNRWIKWKWTNEIEWDTLCVCVSLCTTIAFSFFFCWNVLPIFFPCHTRFTVGGLYEWRFWKKKFKSFWKVDTTDFFQNESEMSTSLSFQKMIIKIPIDNRSDDLITWLWHDYYKPNTRR